MNFILDYLKFPTITGAPRSPKALIDRDVVPNPTQGTAVQDDKLLPVWRRPLRLPKLVAARPRLILTFDLLKFPTISPPSYAKYINTSLQDLPNRVHF